MEYASLLKAATLFAIVVVCCLYYGWNSSQQHTQSVGLVIKRNLEIKWGTTYRGLAPSYNVKYDCQHQNHSICCGLLSGQGHHMPAHMNETSARLPGRPQHVCKVEKKYFPSAYETAHLLKAKEISNLTNIDKRKAELMRFLRADISASNAWLARVKSHMASENTPPPTDDDIKYLSRFEVTRTCPNDAHSSSWSEWIEPLTMHGRHPFALVNCQNLYTPAEVARMNFTAKLQSLDYILIQSGKSLHEATAVTVHNHTRFAAHHNHHAAHRDDHVQTHNYILDAGTSTFESSMMWFLCAYLQRKIPFDQEFGFEYTLLEPQDFWKRVPARVKPFYHFFNAPIAPGVDDEMSPLSFIKDIATEEDFVAFKLDVDTPELEIPLALALARKEEVSRLVDEFFFELHFRCELMMYCGWGDKMPAEYMGLKLERYHAMKFFQEMREQGIRSHFWP